MQSQWTDGRAMREVAAEWIKPNDRLTSFERLQIYNRCYWYRVLDCLYDDYPGLQAVLGERKFRALITAYLESHPSISFTLRDLGSQMEAFMEAHPEMIAPRGDLALDMARFEWAQIIAFDDPAYPAVEVDELLGTNPAELRLGIQPYVTFLDLKYPVDEFALAIKASEEDSLSSQASNVVNEAPKAKRRRTVRLPKPEAVKVAVHRWHNMLYFKRLGEEQFALLQALRRGETLEEACGVALELWQGTPEAFSAEVRSWFENGAALKWFCRYREPKKSEHS